MVPHQSRKTLNMFASPVTKKTQAFAGAIGRGADADVVNVGKPQAMNDEGPPADLARDFLEDIMLRAFPAGDGEQSDAGGVGGLHQSNHARRLCGHVDANPPTNSPGDPVFDCVAGGGW